MAPLWVLQVHKLHTDRRLRGRLQRCTVALCDLMQVAAEQRLACALAADQQHLADAVLRDDPFVLHPPNGTVQCIACAGTGTVLLVVPAPVQLYRWTVPVPVHGWSVPVVLAAVQATAVSLIPEFRSAIGLRHGLHVLLGAVLLIDVTREIIFYFIFAICVV